MVERATDYPISPSEYRVITSGIQTGLRIAGCMEGIWPKNVPVEYRELVAKTTPLERRQGLSTGRWPFSLEDLRDRSSAVERMARDQVGKNFGRSLGGSAWKFNLEELLP